MKNESDNIGRRTELTFKRYNFKHHNAIPFIPAGDYYAGNRIAHKTYGVMKER